MEVSVANVDIEQVSTDKSSFELLRDASTFCACRRNSSFPNKVLVLVLVLVLVFGEGVGRHCLAEVKRLKSHPYRKEEETSTPEATLVAPGWLLGGC